MNRMPPKFLCAILCYLANKYPCILGQCPLTELCPDKMLTATMLTTGRGRGRLGPLAVPIFLTPGMTAGTTVGFFRPLSNLDTQMVEVTSNFASSEQLHVFKC